MSKDIKTKKEIIRVAGRLKEVLTVTDRTGNILHKIINPLMVEFHARDVVQILVGSSILAIPVGFTQEVWDLGTTLPMSQIYALAGLSLMFISIFVYYNFYRSHFREHWVEFLKRVLVIYILSAAVVALILTIIQVTPWQTDWVLAIKRVVLVSFPASMSAAVADMIK